MSQWSGFTSDWYAGKSKADASIAPAEKASKPSKMRNQPAQRGSIRFQSTLEAKYYDYLQFLCGCGQVLYFLRQVPFEMPGGTKYRTDFMVFWQDGRHEIIDVKGRETAQFKLKKREIEALYPITIKVIKKGDFPELAP